MESTVSTDATPSPNIVLIVADDMGYSDIGCFGSEISTPNLNAMAARGMRLSQFYNGARCCPSRAALLTGLYAQQAGIGHMAETGTESLRGYVGHLNGHCVTIAEALRAAGYRTGMVGKWHVGGRAPWSEGELDLRDVVHPLDRGFEEFWGTLIGAGSYYAPRSLMSGRDRIDSDASSGVFEEFYYTDEIGRRSAEMIERMAATGEPFFAYVAHVAPHWPLHALEEDIELMDQSYGVGWSNLRQERHERLRELGVLERSWTIAKNDAVSEWDSARDKAWEEMRMRVYAAQVYALDRAVGRVLESLERAGVADDTVVIFLSDNGGCAEELGTEGSEPLRRLRTSRGDTVLAGNRQGLVPGSDATYMSYGRSWANASNSPFRMYKHWVHEGGISTPFVVQWPRVIPAGSINHDSAHLVDVMATCLDLAGAVYPRQFGGEAIVPLEGQSLRAVFEGRDTARVGAIFWEHEGNRAVRLGELKLVSLHGRPWELYRMDRDRTETDDVSLLYGHSVRQMESLWLDWARRAYVEPWEVVEKQLTAWWT